MGDWDWSGFADSVADFAIGAFDAFVYDTTPDTGNFLFDTPGSIWQQGWDAIDSIFSDDMGSGEKTIYEQQMEVGAGAGDHSIGNLQAEMAAEQWGLKQQPQSTGLLNRLGRSWDQYSQSDKFAGDALKYTAGGIAGYYKNKQEEERRKQDKEKWEQQQKDYRQRTRRAYPTHGGFKVAK